MKEEGDFWDSCGFSKIFRIFFRTSIQEFSIINMQTFGIICPWRIRITETEKVTDSKMVKQLAISIGCKFIVEAMPLHSRMERNVALIIYKSYHDNLSS